MKNERRKQQNRQIVCIWKLNQKFFGFFSIQFILFSFFFFGQNKLKNELKSLETNLHKVARWIPKRFISCWALSLAQVRAHWIRKVKTETLRQCNSRYKCHTRTSHIDNTQTHTMPNGCSASTQQNELGIVIFSDLRVG